MLTHMLSGRTSVALGAVAALVLIGAPAARAQGSGMGLELHANENVSASTMGLPHFPTSHPYKGESKDSAADVGFTFGNVHFRVITSRYETNASADQVVEFYRKALARYGEVLECEHGQAVGPVKQTKEGLTCDDSHGKHSHVNADYDSTSAAAQRDPGALPRHGHRGSGVERHAFRARLSRDAEGRRLALSDARVTYGWIHFAEPGYILEHRHGRGSIGLHDMVVSLVS